MAKLEGRELYRFYHNDDSETFALRGVNLSLEAGELVALVGPSGSGKSTLLACLAGLDTPDGGTVFVEGQRISRQSEEISATLRARHIGILMQSGNLLEHLSVDDNVRMQRRLARAKSDDVDWLSRLGLGPRRKALPAELSGGEAARAGLAVALSAGAGILLCDEPTAEVDAETEILVLSALRRRRDEGACVLIATHSAIVADAADRTITITDGRLRS